MTKDTTRSKGVWVSGAAFAAFSGMVALGWTRGADLWALQETQEHYSRLLNTVLGIFSLFGVEVSGIALLLLLAGLFLCGRRALAGRVLAAFVATGLLELALKLYLPQSPVPEGTVRGEDYAPLLEILTPYSYPSGHMIRSVILFGALYLLSGNRLLRAGLLTALAGVAGNRIFFGMHWPSDVVGGALLGLAGLLWAFQPFSRSAASFFTASDASSSKTGSDG